MIENPFEDVSEKKITNKILKMLRKDYPGVWYKIHGGPYQEAGIPDIVGCHKGRFYGIEVKKPDKRSNVSAQQYYQLDRLIAHGAICAVVTSVEETKAVMEGKAGDSFKRINALKTGARVDNSKVGEVVIDAETGEDMVYAGSTWVDSETIGPYLVPKDKDKN